MYLVITEQEVLKAKKFSDIEKKHNIVFQKEEFSRLGDDYVLNIRTEDIQFVKDRKTISNIVMSSLYESKDSKNWLLYTILVLNIIALLK